MKRVILVLVGTVLLLGCYGAGEISPRRAMLVSPGTKKAAVVRELGTPKKIRVSQVLEDGRAWEIWEYRTATFDDPFTDAFLVEMVDGVVTRTGAPAQFKSQTPPDAIFEFRNR